MPRLTWHRAKLMRIPHYGDTQISPSARHGRYRLIGGQPISCPACRGGRGPEQGRISVALTRSATLYVDDLTGGACGLKKAADVGAVASHDVGSQVCGCLSDDSVDDVACS
jgi:hypothetical protein